MDLQQLSVLIEKYLSGDASEEERRLVDQWYDSFDADPALFNVAPELENEEAIEEGFHRLRTHLQL